MAHTAHETEAFRKTLTGLQRFPSIVFHGWMIASAALVLIFIFGPLSQTVFAPEWNAIVETIADKDVIRSIGLSLFTSCLAALIALIFGTPLAYILARRQFFGKKFIESIIDLPIMIPHPVVGIALLTISGRNHPVGEFLISLNIRLMGSITGIVTVMVFVGMPFFVNTVKAGIEGIPKRLENVSRSLGASRGATFFRVLLPLSWRYLLVGMIMCMARGLSEFGAIIIIAYHPMVAPVLMYERFTAYGLKYSQPVAVILIIIALIFFMFLRILSHSKSTIE